MLDRRKFNEGMAVLCEIFERQVSDFFLKGYYMVLQDLTEEEFERAVMGVMGSHKFSKIPMPAEIKEFARGSKEDAPVLALDKLERAMSSVGKYRSVVFDDPIIMAAVSSMGGWPKICSMEADEWKWARKEFEKIYKAFSARGSDTLQIPERLAGLAEIANGANGYEDQPQIAYIGRQDVPLLSA